MADTYADILRFSARKEIERREQLRDWAKKKNNKSVGEYEIEVAKAREAKALLDAMLTKEGL